MVTIRGVNVYPTAIENVIRQFGSVDEFQVTVTTVHEMHQLEIEIEVLSGNDSNMCARMSSKLFTTRFRCARQSKWQKPGTPRPF